MLRAVELFDSSRGTKFSTYAAYWIKEAIQEAIIDKGGVIRIPAYMKNALFQVARARRLLATELGREPTVKEVADNLEVPEETVRRIMATRRKVVSLEAPFGQKGGGTVEEVIPGEGRRVDDLLEEHELISKLTEAIMELRRKGEECQSNGDQKSADKYFKWVFVLTRHFGLGGGEPETLGVIGQQLTPPVTRESVRVIKEKAFAFLRKSFPELRALL